MTATGGLMVRVLGPCIVTEHVADRDDHAARGYQWFEDTDDPVLAGTVELTAVQKRIVARLALAKPDPVDPGELMEAVWGDAPPTTARTALQNQISRLRGRLGRDSILTTDGRYVLALPTDVDVVTGFLRSVDAVDGTADRLSGPGAAGEVGRMIALWRGVPYADLDEPDELMHERSRLAEMRRSLETVRLERAIEAGQLAWAVPEAERLVARTPGDEHRWALLVRALERSGRRGDALGAFERARRTLITTMGLEPSAELRAAEAAALGAPVSVGSSGSVHLIGRDGTIDRIVDACRRGEPVVVCGEDGVGKSRVLGAVQRRLAREGYRLATHECPTYPATAVSTLRDLADELGIELGVGSPPIESFVEAVGTARRHGPIAMVVDDLDRTGPTTMHALCEVAGLDGVAFVAAADDIAGSGVDRCATVIELEPLDHDESVEFARAALGDDPALEEEHLRWLHEMSGGNPGLLEHLVGDVSWLTEPETGIEPAESPRSIDRPVLVDDTISEPVAPDPGFVGSERLWAAVRRRLDRLDPLTRSTLEVAAVCGPRCPVAVLAAFGVEEGIAAAVDASLLEFDRTSEESRYGGSDVTGDTVGWVRFRHGVVRRILYEDLPSGHRMEIHYRAAELLRDWGAPPAAVAAHSLRAFELDLDRTCRDSIAAAEHSAADGAHADAVQWLERALEVVERGTAEDGCGASLDGRLEVQIMVMAADQMRLAGSTDQESMQFAAVEAAFELGDSDLIARAAFAALQLGATTESGVAHERVEKLTSDALAVVTDPDDRALIAASASLAHSMSGQAEVCRELFLDAISWATEPETRCLILPFTYLSLGHPSDLDLRESLTAELLELAAAEEDPVGRFEGLQLAHSVGLMRCDGRRARQAVLESLGLIDRVRDIGRMWSLRYQQAAVAHLDGELDRAETLATEAMALFEPISPSRAFAAYGGQLLAIRLAQGRLGELAGTIEGLLVEQPGVPAWNAALALALVDTDPVRAQELARAALHGAERDFTWLAAHLIGGRAAAVVGDDDTRRTYVERLAPWSGHGSWQGTCSYGPVDTVLWLLYRSLGEDRSARRSLEGARRCAEGLDSPLFLAELED